MTQKYSHNAWVSEHHNANEIETAPNISYTHATHGVRICLVQGKLKTW